MTQTAITYLIVTTNYFTGERIKTILEDVADNIFHADPYYQQGGDMVRVGGLCYAIDIVQANQGFTSLTFLAIRSPWQDRRIPLFRGYFLTVIGVLKQIFAG